MENYQNRKEEEELARKINNTHHNGFFGQMRASVYAQKGITNDDITKKYKSRLEEEERLRLEEMVDFSDELPLLEDFD